MPLRAPKDLRRRSPALSPRSADSTGRGWKSGERAQRARGWGQIYSSLSESFLTTPEKKFITHASCAVDVRYAFTA